ncbi:acyl-homoserine-lactone acylase [Saccharothrix coeruleofusca]|uniref:penicillin acylase family protein n=1 Tax=Saccharothrix coeruleofusca TaxID=33919 RepID=UPI001AE77058|nr:penicillin acylase family protein [Saccharothrix coeruleofusca]MBP2334767.1 acyl-homoserine-lactone acylase [Saccharothrix coeruleofusca]
MRRVLKVCAVVVTLVAGLATPVHGRPIGTTIRYTEHGIPHIIASDHLGLGYGYGYASAQDNLCVLADTYLTVEGKRSLHLGPDGPVNSGVGSVSTNLNSDLYFQRINGSGVIDGYARSVSPPVRDLVHGYVRGYNRYLAQSGQTCNGTARPIAERDVYRHVYAITLVSGSGAMIDGLVSAQPPAAVTGQAPVEAAALVQRLQPDFSLGSNAIAAGSEDAANGGSVLLANPHYPWQGVRRFWQAHLTIPGRLNVSGASLLGIPVLAIGHNEDVAWSHTVSTAVTAGLFEVPTVPGAPTEYLVDGVRKKMTSQEVVVEVRRPDGSIGAVTRTLWATEYGPVLAGVSGVPLPWGATVYVLRDANATNFRLLDTWAGLNRAGSVGDLRETLSKTLGLPWVNTLAVDRRGNSLYADIQVAPHVTDEHAKKCSTPLGAVVFPQSGTSILDGSRGECAWGSDPDAREPGLLGPGRLPVLIRRDTVANANNTPWIANPDAPLTGYPRVLGTTATELSMRAQELQLEVRRRVGGTDSLPGRGFTNETMRSLLFADRSRAAEVVLADTVRMCEAFPGGKAPSGAGPVDVTAACAALARWDGTFRLDSSGAAFFSRFWLRVRSSPGLWKVPFDPAEPLSTPNTLAVDLAEIQQAFGDAAQELTAAGVAHDAPLGASQYVTRAGQRIPIHGSQHELGVLNVITPVWGDGGYTDVVYGSSFVQVVEFRAGRPPEAHSLMTYSQSTDPSSPHHADQTALFSRGDWVRERFTEKDIHSSPALRIVRLVGNLR